MGGAHEWVQIGIHRAADELWARGELEPYIIVLPEGGMLTYWLNHANGGPRYEDYLVQDVVGEIDARYRTLADPEHRAVGGLSMGGDGALRFAVSETATSRLIGFSVGNTGTQANEIVYGLRLRSGLLEVREAGVYRKDVPFTTGDVFEIRVEGGVVRYLKNDSVFYTSPQAPRYPLVVDTSLSTVGAAFSDVLIKQGS